MVMASLLFSVMNVCVYAVAIYQPELSAMTVSFVRVSVNLVILVIPALAAGRPASLFGDGRASLWLRGLFGAVALMLSFTAIQRIGPGESSFLNASSGLFVVLLGPWLLSQRNSRATWLAVLGAFAGIFLLFEPRWDGDDFPGRAMALLGGLLSALAYLMVARAGRSNSPESVIFYFCLVAITLHVAWFAWAGYSIPTLPEIWALMLLGGLAASGAQHFMTRAYQTAPAALVSAVGYAAPVLSLAWGIVFFDRIPDPRALVGCALVLGFGVLLPFLTRAER
ncbi:DMT family transporter [Methylococcus sp. EFPC2]|nr:DMT family transporter [Methylococcus sp. EFPC2]